MEETKPADQRQEDQNPIQSIVDLGSSLIQTERGTIYVLTVVGQIEGHQMLPPSSQTTKYEHVLPLLAMGLFLPFTGPMCNLIWLFAGASMQKLFANHRKTVDIVMAVSLALCAVNMVWPH